MRPCALVRSTMLATAIALTACAGGEELQKQLDTIASWTATMQLAVAEHRAHAVTTTYARLLEEAATKALDDARQSLARDESDERRAAAALDSLDRAVRALHAEAVR